MGVAYMRIAIVGGSYDPPHKGHLAMAYAVLNAGEADQVWLMPCPSHAFGKQMSPSGYRLEMCYLASDDPRIIASSLEMAVGDGMTIHLVEHLKEMMPDYEFSYVIGMDNARAFDKWFEHQRLAKEIRFITLRRNGVQDIEWATKLPHKVLDFKTPAVSSTMIRSMIKNGEPLGDLVSPAVERYIEKHGLYRVYS
jgi:nicotinate-nucleotide adenylyltransferase